MSKRIVTIILCLSSGFLWSQSRADKRQNELEIDVMASILETTLRYVARTDEMAGVRIVSRNVRGYYLPNQGVIFEIPTPSIRTLSRRGGVSGSLLEIARTHRDRSDSEERQALSREELHRLQEEARQRKSTSGERWAKYAKELKTMTGYLVEALAEHGDSLASLPDNEFVNLVYRSSSGSDYTLAFAPTTVGSGRGVYTLDTPGGKSSVRTVSLQKSWINDFKSGRLTLEQIKEKAIYN